MITNYDPLVPGSVTAAMRSLLDQVSRGATLYVCGKVGASKALALAAKFDERYDLRMSNVRRDHARRAGRSTFRLVMFPDPHSTDLFWWLLRTPGEHPLASLEDWRDARRHYVHWPWLYELVQLPVSVAHRRKLQGVKKRQIKPVGWTWRFDAAEVHRLKEMIRHVAQFKDDRLEQIVHGLCAAPGFRGVRQHVIELLGYIRDQCRRRDRPPPPMPITIRWVGAYRSVKTYPLSTLVRRVQRGRVSWFPSGPGNAQEVGTSSDHAPLPEARDEALRE